jgi:hypothetical protein
LAASYSLARGYALTIGGKTLAHGLRTSLGRLLPRRTHSTRLQLPPWLTPYASSKLAANLEADIGSAVSNDAGERRTRALLAPFQTAMSSAFTNEATPFGLEIRLPFRDRRLVEFFLDLPAHLMYRPGESKRLLRRALMDRLPQEVLQRRQITSLLALARRGLVEHGWSALRAILENRKALWPRYVRPEWLWRYGADAIGGGGSSAAGLVLWHCYSLERWRQSLESGAKHFD